MTFWFFSRRCIGLLTRFYMNFVFLTQYCFVSFLCVGIFFSFIIDINVICHEAFVVFYGQFCPSSAHHIANYVFFFCSSGFFSLTFCVLGFVFGFFLPTTATATVSGWGHGELRFNNHVNERQSNVNYVLRNMVNRPWTFLMTIDFCISRFLVVNFGFTTFPARDFPLTLFRRQPPGK